MTYEEFETAKGLSKNITSTTNQISVVKSMIDTINADPGITLTLRLGNIGSVQIPRQITMDIINIIVKAFNEELASAKNDFGLFRGTEAKLDDAEVNVSAAE